MRRRIPRVKIAPNVTRGTTAVALALTLLSGTDVATAATRVTDHSESTITHASLSGSSWLGEINLYRVGAGLVPVTDEQAWDVGITDHLTYLEKTPQSYFTGPYESLHTENPASPYYTVAGAKEGESSDLYEGVGDDTDVQIIDGWLEAPFHAVGMLRASLGQVAFGDHLGDAALDVISGLNENPDATSPVLFPGNGMTTDLTSANAEEEPSPLQTCKWKGSVSAGLPLIALLTQAPAAGLTATLTSGRGTTQTSAADTLCIVDANTYVTTDPVYGPTGLEILQGDDAVFLIPKTQLVQGTYTATINQPGESAITWSFHVETPPTVATGALPRARVGSPFKRSLVAKGGVGPYRWSVLNKLPAGIRLSSSGALTGTPRTNGTFPVEVVATDALGHVSAPRYIELRVSPR